MGKRIQEILEQERQKQPIAELERKWNKSKGRHGNRYFTAECLDLAAAQAKELAKFFL